MPTSLPPNLHQHCKEILNADIRQVQYVGGGDINQARLLKTTRGDFFIKLNQAAFAADMFEKEAKGLALLAEPTWDRALTWNEDNSF